MCLGSFFERLFHAHFDLFFFFLHIGWDLIAIDTKRPIGGDMHGDVPGGVAIPAGGKRNQHADAPAEIPLELAFLRNGEVYGRTMELREAHETARFSLSAPPSGLEVDPETWLLHRATVEGPAPEIARATSSNEVQDDD